MQKVTKFHLHKNIQIKKILTFSTSYKYTRSSHEHVNLRKKKLFKYIDMSETFVIIKKKLINYTVAIVSFKKHDDSQGFVVLKKNINGQMNVYKYTGHCYIFIWLMEK